MYKHFYVDNGKYSDFLAENGLSCLISYAMGEKYLNKVIDSYFNKYPNRGGEIMLDSGAYSVSNGVLEINEDEYIDYVNKNGIYFGKIMQLDLIPTEKISPEESGEKTFENLKKMLDKVNCPEKIGFVYHTSEDYKWLHMGVDYISNIGRQCGFVCLAGAASVSHPREMLSNLESAYGELKKSSRPNIYLHILGLSMPSILRRFQINSSDGSSYFKWSMRHRIHYHTGNGKFIVLHFSETAKEKSQGYFELSERERRTFDEKLKSYNLDWNLVFNKREEKTKFNIYNYEEGFKYCQLNIGKAINQKLF